MDSSLIGKVEKAKRYAEERERVRFSHFAARIQGDNRSHEVIYQDGRWGCTCAYFPSHGICSHTMAMERILEAMLPASPASLQARVL